MYMLGEHIHAQIAALCIDKANLDRRFELGAMYVAHLNIFVS